MQPCRRLGISATTAVSIPAVGRFATVFTRKGKGGAACVRYIYIYTREAVRSSASARVNGQPEMSVSVEGSHR